MLTSSDPSKFSALKGVVLGPVCRHGHDHTGHGESFRHESNWTCAECQRARIARWHSGAGGKASRAASKFKHSAQIRASAKEYRKKNRARIVAYNSAYRREKRDWFLTYYRSYNAARKAAIIRATPEWADMEEIKGVYRAAHDVTSRTGKPHDVDHIVPLRSKLVCGLHVAANLRVIAATDNVAKGNRWWPDGPFQDRLDYYNRARAVFG